MKEKIKLALLISDGGTTAEAIIKACLNGRLNIDPVLVIASKPDIKGISRVKNAGIKKEDVLVISPTHFKTPDEFADKLLKECKKRRVDLIGQYGWLPLTPEDFIKYYEGRIINQHPGPLDPSRPDFGGIYGRKVHAAVLLFRRMTRHDFWTEATAHLVIPKFDKGDVINRQQIPINEDDTVEDLRARVLPIEHELQIRTLEDIVNGRMKVLRREEPLIRESEYDILKTSIKIGRLLYPHG